MGRIFFSNKILPSSTATCVNCINGTDIYIISINFISITYEYNISDRTVHGVI